MPAEGVLPGLDAKLESHPDSLPAVKGLGDDLLARIEARLGRKLAPTERAILARPPAKEPSLSFLAYQILSELRHRRERLLLPFSGVLTHELAANVMETRSRPWAEILLGLWPVPFIVSDYAGGGQPSLLLPGLLVLGVVQTALVLASELRLKKKVDAGLRDISLIMRAIEADPGLLEIREHVPPPWSWLFFSGKYRSLKDYVALLSANLDWYLGPPRMLLRWSWITGPLGAAALAIAVWFWGLGPGGAPGVNTMAVAMAGFYLLVYALRHESSRRAYFIDKLIEVLRTP